VLRTVPLAIGPPGDIAKNYPPPISLCGVLYSKRNRTGVPR